MFRNSKEINERSDEGYNRDVPFLMSPRFPVNHSVVCLWS